VAEGAELVRESTAARAPSIAVILYALVLAHPVLFAARHLVRPRTVEEMRPVLAHVAQHRRPDDRVYVYASAAPAFAYYGPRAGIPEDRIVPGEWAADPAGAGKDAEKLHGQGRIWVLFSHFVRPDGTDDRSRFLPLLDAAGRRLEEFRAPGAAVYLYDMPQRRSGEAAP
jgi:hypothetical protein